MNSFLSKPEIIALGIATVGNNVLISRKASLYGSVNIHIGHNVRIDDFCILSAGEKGIYLGNYIHIAAYSSLIGKGCIVMGDYSGISSRVSIYSSNDDYSGKVMTNPTVPDKFTGVKHQSVLIGRHVIIGTGSIVLPGVTINDGVAIGALSLVNKNCREFGIYAGTPAKRIADRSRSLLEIEQQWILEENK